jgi:hypothetical protein
MPMRSMQPMRPMKRMLHLNYIRNSVKVVVDAYNGRSEADIGPEFMSTRPSVMGLGMSSLPE